MRAIDPGPMPATLPAYAAMLWHRRRGLQDPAAMPTISRSAQALRLRPGWLQAYREAIGLDRGDGTGTLPPLALQMAAAPLHLSVLADPRFPFKALGLVHVAQTITQARPIAADEVFELRVCTGPAQWARRGMQFGLTTEAWCAGQRLWRGETTALAFGAGPVTDGQGARREEERSEAEPEGAPWREAARLVVPEALGRRYAAIAGDLNPIHQHALLARPFGFRRAIIHGTWTLARALAAAGLPRGGSFDLEARFRKPVELPSAIRVGTRAQDGQDEVRVASDDGSLLHLVAQVRQG